MNSLREMTHTACSLLVAFFFLQFAKTQEPPPPPAPRPPYVSFSFVGSDGQAGVLTRYSGYGDEYTTYVWLGGSKWKHLPHDPEWPRHKWGRTIVAIDASGERATLLYEPTRYLGVPPDRQFVLWNLREGKQERLLHVPLQRYRPECIFTDRGKIAVFRTDFELFVWDVLEGKSLYSVEIPRIRRETGTFRYFVTPDENHLYTCLLDESGPLYQLRELRTGKIVLSEVKLAGWAYSADGRLACRAYDSDRKNKRLEIWNVAKQELLRTIVPQNAGLYQIDSVRFADNDRLIWASHHDGVVRAHEVSTGEHQFDLRVATRIGSIAGSQNGGFVHTHDGRGIVLWDVVNRKPKWVADISSDGQLVFDTEVPPLIEPTNQPEATTQPIRNQTWLWCLGAAAVSGVFLVCIFVIWAIRRKRTMMSARN